MWNLKVTSVRFAVGATGTVSKDPEELVIGGRIETRELLKLARTLRPHRQNKKLEVLEISERIKTPR